ncbi:MAG TPA: hypothetical protein VFL15_11130 [Gammaproteobacteria bacterium]|nr:hypothetical protein [Gammaproteobacteria bacterium]
MKSEPRNRPESIRPVQLGFLRLNTVGSLLSVRSFSYGGTAAIVTSMSLVMGLNAAMASRTAIIAGLLIIAIADNLTDSLSIHIYQESERLESRRAFVTTLANYAARLLVSCSFLLLVLLLPVRLLTEISMLWGLLLLAVLTCALNWNRKSRIPSEIIKHATVALLAILASRMIGTYIGTHFH